MVLSLWSWVQCYGTVFSNGAHNNALVYALWLFIPAANLILNATQLTTVTSLFGIAATVQKRLNDRQAEESTMSRVLSLQPEDEEEYTSSKTELESIRFRS